MRRSQHRHAPTKSPSKNNPASPYCPTTTPVPIAVNTTGKVIICTGFVIVKKNVDAKLPTCSYLCNPKEASGALVKNVFIPTYSKSSPPKNRMGSCCCIKKEEIAVSPKIAIAPKSISALIEPNAEERDAR